LQNSTFHCNKNMPGYLIQYDEHPNLKILKNQILSSCGHSVEHWQEKIKSNQTSLCCTVLARCNPVAMPLDGALVEPSPLCPDPSPGRRRRRAASTLGPPRSSSQQPARRRPPCPRQRRPTALRGRDRSLPARPRGRRALGRSTHTPGPPQRRASGHACTRRSGL
jgi:hypothetical protein